MSRFPLVILLTVFFNRILWAKSVSTRTRRNALRNVRKLWPKGVVTYVLDKNFDTEQWRMIRRAMKKIEGFSCIEFKERFNETAYVNITKGTGCRATIGYTGVPQRLTMGVDCFSTPLILHELFHVLGFFHEHSRPDRDEYIEVLRQNIIKGKESAFRKENYHLVKTLSLPYDYRSIMHYPPTKFSKDGVSKTIVVRNPSSDEQEIVMGPGLDLSQLDIHKLNRLYNCRLTL